MVYLPGIPAATDKPAQSQSDIQENFAQLNNQYKTEHVAFDAASSNGQHKFVTLRQSAGVPPTGSKITLSQALTTAPLSNPYLQVYFGNAAGYPNDFYSVPLMKTFTKHITGGSHTFNLVDFGAAGLNLIAQTGNIFIYDDSNRTRTIFSPFVYIGGTLTIPSGAGINGQLRSGATFYQLIGTGSVLQLETNSAPVTDVVIKITGNAV